MHIVIFSGIKTSAPDEKRSFRIFLLLLDDRSYYARTYRSAALADCKPQSFLDGDVCDQLNRHLDVVSRHYHLYALRQLNNTCYVRRSEVELRSVAVEERCMPSALFLRQYVYL